MEIFIIIFVIVILAIAAAVLVALYYLRKGYRFIKRVANGEMTEEEFERLSKKNYRSKNSDGPKFDDDYFKSANKGQQKDSNRTFRTADGITITDQRNSHQSKKIFAQDEGEYIDFKEVKNDK